MRNRETTPRLLTPAQVARRLSISRASAYRKIASGEIPAFRIGEKPRSAVRVDAAELEAWLCADSGEAAA